MLCPVPPGPLPLAVDDVLGITCLALTLGRGESDAKETSRIATTRPTMSPDQRQDLLVTDFPSVSREVFVR